LRHCYEPVDWTGCTCFQLIVCFQRESVDSIDDAAQSNPAKNDTAHRRESNGSKHPQQCDDGQYKQPQHQQSGECGRRQFSGAPRLRAAQWPGKV